MWKLFMPNFMSFTPFYENFHAIFCASGMAKKNQNIESTWIECQLRNTSNFNSFQTNQKELRFQLLKFVVAVGSS